MNVFIIGSPLETAQALDKRRLNKQIIECRQILDALYNYKIGWKNHPCTLSYKNDRDWLWSYCLCLEQYREGEYNQALYWNNLAEKVRPVFHTQEYFDQMKRRLYTKSPEYYAQWSELGTSEVNWYYVAGEWRYYKDGKRVKI
jgi:hypothetical protein